MTIYSRGRCRISALAVLLAGLLVFHVQAIDPRDTRLVADPAVSRDQIAFAYANDLWTAKLDGSDVRRLTAHPGVESGPRYSPDGSLIAFTGRYEGNTDVYVVESAGAVPRRLTWHPDDDVALGFTPDGKSVLFASPREVYTRRYTQLFTVPVEGGISQAAPDSQCQQGVVCPGREDDRLRAAPGGVRPVEALPRRHGRADLPVRRPEPGGRTGAPARQPMQ